MQTINQLLPQHNNNQAMKPTATISWQNLNESLQNTAINAHIMTAIAAMFTTWKPLFKTKMKESEWGLDTVKIWTLALTEMNITPDEFAMAHKKSLSLEWQPTTPVDFIKLARFGGVDEFPDMQKAYFDGANKKYDHEVVYEACRRVGFLNMHKGLERETYPKWREIYPQVCEEYRQGARFTVPETNQLGYKHTVADDNVAQNHLAKIKAMLAGMGA